MKAGKVLPGAVLTLGELVDKYEKDLARFKPFSATKHGNLKRWKESLGDRPTYTGRVPRFLRSSPRHNLLKFAG